MKLNTGIVQIFHIPVFTAAVLAKIHDVSHKFRGAHDRRFNKGFLSSFYYGRVRVIQWVIHHYHFAVCLGHAVNNAGSRGDKVKIVFSFKALLDYLHMEKPQKSASEAKSKGNRGFRLKGE